MFTEEDAVLIVIAVALMPKKIKRSKWVKKVG
jgi:hypothetical protein